MNKISIIGTGAWATALASVCAKNKHSIVMYGIDEKEIKDINSGFNTKYFKNPIKYKNIKATLNLKDALNKTDLIILAIPSQHIANILKQIQQILKNKKVNLINVAKGLDGNTKQFYSQLIRKNFGSNLQKLATIIGPSFAQEVFDEKLTMVNVVGNNADFLNEMTQIFNNDSFILIPSTKEHGLEMFAAMKNVLAIGIGMIKFFHPEDMNPLSAMFSIGFKEMFLIYKTIYPLENDAIGYELAAIGDSFLTCSSFKSRNTSFGALVAEHGVQKALKMNNNTVEGYSNAKFVGDLIEKHKINTPFISSIINILNNKKNAKDIYDFVGRIKENND